MGIFKIPQPHGQTYVKIHVVTEILFESIQRWRPKTELTFQHNDDDDDDDDESTTTMMMTFSTQLGLCLGWYGHLMVLSAMVFHTAAVSA